jgi:lipoprotein-releasing system ATP-binding protein
MSAILRAVNLEKTYVPLKQGAEGLSLFRRLSFEVEQGEMVAIVGSSGSGKSSLLHLIAALDHASAGEVWCDQTLVTSLDIKRSAAYRNFDIGYVWQFHYLLPEFTALENVAMPLLARGVRSKAALSAAAVWLDRVGLHNRADNRSGELSGGEQQRLSIARALITKPRLLLADEPTGDLDNATGNRIFDLLQQIHHEERLTSVIVTHNLDFASRCDRVLQLRDGRLEPIEP